MPEKQAFMITSSGARNFNLEDDLDNSKDDDSDAEDKINLFVPKAEASLVTNNNMTLWAINFDQLLDKSTYQSVPFNPEPVPENQTVSELNPAPEENENKMTVEKEEIAVETTEVTQIEQINPEKEQTQ